MAISIPPAAPDARAVRQVCSVTRKSVVVLQTLAGYAHEINAENDAGPSANYDETLCSCIEIGLKHLDKYIRFLRQRMHVLDFMRIRHAPLFHIGNTAGLSCHDAVFHLAAKLLCACYLRIFDFFPSDDTKSWHISGSPWLFGEAFVEVVGDNLPHETDESHPLFATLRAERVDTLARLPTDEPAILNANDPRDKWIYDECFKGTDYAKIIAELKKNREGWEWIDSIPGIKGAASRYAKRHKLTTPPKRQSGRRSSPEM